jgi:hypothetical protein
VRSPTEPMQVPQKTQGPKERGPKRFLFPVSVFQREAPKSPRSPENVRPQNVKIEAPKSGAPNGFLFPVSARDPKSVGPQRVQGPQKQSPKIKKREAPKFKKRGSKSRAANKFICSFDSLGKGLQKARPSKSYRGQKISKFVVNC